MNLISRFSGALNEVDRLIFGNITIPSTDPFDIARLRLSIRLTWIFAIAGLVYCASLVQRGGIFLVAFSTVVSLMFLTIPYTIKWSLWLRNLIFSVIACAFIVVNIFGSGNLTSVPIVLWMVFTVQLAYVILTPRASIPLATFIIIVYGAKWIGISEGYQFPNWIPASIVENPRLADFATPIFFNLFLTYNSFRLSEWARNQIRSSQARVASLNKVVADSERRNQLIVEQSLGYISIHDKFGVVTFVNKAASESLGYLPSELIGLPVSVILDPAFSHEFNKYLATVTRQGFAEGIMRVRNKSGKTLFWYYRNIRIADEKDGFTFLCFAHDVTELELTRQQLQKARVNAEESDRLKSLFLANISHEFRTPMNAIIGFSELLEKPNLAPDRRVEFTRFIRERSLTLLGMLNNLIDFSRIEAGAVKLHEIDGDIDELMDRVVINTIAETQYLNQKDIKVLKANHLPEGMHKVRLDFFKLNQVLVNLMSNAVKFTERGSVQLTCDDVEPHLLRFSVADTGTGIPNEKLATLFQPFHQANVTSEIQFKYRGAGLGLAICKGFVESWKGKINVTSTEGEGTVFTFTIPFKPANRDAAEVKN